MPIEALVPEAHARDRLIGGLGKLCRQRGWERLVAGPIFEPIGEHFPDRVKPTVGGLRRIVKRLLHYADLGELDLSVELFDGHDPDSALITPEGHDVAAWFAGIDDGVCRFGLDVRQALQPEHAVGVLAHEVAHAYRRFHGLEVMDRETEEQLTDLTTVYLGFGVFTTNNTYRYRSHGEIEGYSVRHGWSEQGAGYLPPEAMSFLLAAQALLRNDRTEQKVVRGYLETNQREMFEKSLEVLERPQLMRDLGLPPEENWPEVEDTDAFAAACDVQFEPHDDDAIALLPQNEPESELDSMESYDGPTYVLRVRRSFAMAMTVIVGLLLFSVVMSAARDDAATFWGVLIGGTLLAYVAGRAYGFTTCSLHTCGAWLRRDAEACHACGGIIVGDWDGHSDIDVALDQAIEAHLDSES